jgi:hypothetical protein
MTTIASPLDPQAADIYTLDFTNQLGPGETLASIVSVSVALVAGADPNPAAFLPAAPVPAINQAAATVKLPVPPGIGMPQQTVSIAAGCCIQGAMNLAGTAVSGASYEITGEAQSTNSLRRLVCKLIVPVSAS